MSQYKKQKGVGQPVTPVLGRWSTRVTSSRSSSARGTLSNPALQDSVSKTNQQGNGIKCIYFICVSVCEWVLWASEKVRRECSDVLKLQLVVSPHLGPLQVFLTVDPFLQCPPKKGFEILARQTGDSSAIKSTCCSCIGLELFPSTHTRQLTLPVTLAPADLIPLQASKGFRHTSSAQKYMH